MVVKESAEFEMLNSEAWNPKERSFCFDMGTLWMKGVSRKRNLETSVEVLLKCQTVDVRYWHVVENLVNLER